MKREVMTPEERKDIKEFVSILLVLSKEDRAILLSNAGALKARQDLARKERRDERSIRINKSIAGSSESNEGSNKRTQRQQEKR